MKTINVLICDASAFSRVMLRRVIESARGLQVLDMARNGEEAIEKAIRLRPDVVVMDLHMPVVDGLTALKDIVRLDLAPVITLSSPSPEDAQATLEAIEAGAFDFIPRADDIYTIEELRSTIIQKIKHAAESQFYRNAQKNKPRQEIEKKSALSSSPPKSSEAGGQGFKAAALGLSTGGLRSILKVLPLLPPNLKAAIFVIQHMPPAFNKTFTQLLSRKTAMNCIESEENLRVEPKMIYIARGGTHLKLVRHAANDIRLHHSQDPFHTFMPSVDVGMHSVCDIFGTDTIGVLMTGMGDDGAEAMVRITREGGTTIVESEETAVAPGMPLEAIRRGGAQHVVPNWAIAAEIVKAVEGPEHYYSIAGTGYAGYKHAYPN